MFSAKKISREWEMLLDRSTRIIVELLSPGEYIPESGLYSPIACVADVWGEGEGEGRGGRRQANSPFA